MVDVNKVTVGLKTFIVVLCSLVVTVVPAIWWSAWKVSSMDTRLFTMETNVKEYHRGIGSLNEKFINTVSVMNVKGYEMLNQVNINKKDIEYMKKIIEKNNKYVFSDTDKEIVR